MGHKQKPPRRYRQLKDDYPLIQTPGMDQAPGTDLPDEDDVQRAKNGSDHNQK